MTTYLYETETFTFATPTTTMKHCGTFSYKFIADNDQTYNESVLRMIDRPAQGFENLQYFSFSPVDKNPWLLQQPFSVRIEVSFGSRKIISENAFLYVRDPCENTNIIFRDLLNMKTETGASSPATQTFSHFQDSVSRLYSARYGEGNGFDICGPPEYTLYEVT